ncbi:efflux RND transporter permease subunit [bacterium]|nr:efflux RND transporter permease subunit [bacterium]
MKDKGADTGWINAVIKFCLRNKAVVFMGLLCSMGYGWLVAPFDWQDTGFQRHPLPVDAIPDIGENQQIVFTEWQGRSPEDVEDQITYPLTISLMGVSGVKTVRSHSMFGFSSIYVVFKENIEFHASRSRLLEKMASLPKGTLPADVQPTLGPDATALGQVFWYTLEGQDSRGNPTGGWDLDELRSIQDYYVKYGLMAADGVSEVASVGGFVREYQIDVDPDAMRAFDVSLQEVFEAVRMANIDVGAGTMEVNHVEYVIRGLGFIKSLKDIENSVIKVRDNIPVYIRNVAVVSHGPATRRGALDKEGAEVVGGVVVVRHGENPLTTIQNVKIKIEEIAPGLPSKTLDDGRISQVRIIPFYDRTQLIEETLNTLSNALTGEILVTMIVVIAMVMHLRSSILISGLLPVSVLLCFGAMKTAGIDANIVALSGIAIAIGTMVDMSIIVCENILKHFEEESAGADPLKVTLNATREVSSAVLTAVSTTLISFLPVFTMEAAEGKLFKPLAWTKTFALVAATIVALVILPPLAQILFSGRIKIRALRYMAHWVTLLLGTALILRDVLSWWHGRDPFFPGWLVGIILVLIGCRHLYGVAGGEQMRQRMLLTINGLVALVLALLLAKHWIPLGPEKGILLNLCFVSGMIGGLMAFVHLIYHQYARMLAWCLAHRLVFLAIPMSLLLLGSVIWLGFDSVFGWVPKPIRNLRPLVTLAHAFPGLGREFMPTLDEGSFLYMPTTMPHASVGESMDAMRKQDMAISQIHEINSVVGKLGRAETALDPAPVSMVETVIHYHPRYHTDQRGRLLTFEHNSKENEIFRDLKGKPVNAPDHQPYLVRGKFARDETGKLISKPGGKPFRLWRPSLDPNLNPGRAAWPGIRSPEDIWRTIVQYAKIPGSTSAPKLQPIAARLVMLQSGMRAPMGIKIKGPDLETIETVALQLEFQLKQVPLVESSTVIADRIVGKPYLEIEIDREAIARYGIKLGTVQEIIEVGIGGKHVTTTVEGRERYPVRVRYMRERRDQLEQLGRILVPSPEGVQIPLGQLADIRYRQGPQNIKSEDGFLVGYVLFDKKPAYSEMQVVEASEAYLKDLTEQGTLNLPSGVSYVFAGNYENQIRSEKRLRAIIPLALAAILIILYMQFKSTATTMMVFSSIFVAWSGGFLMLWLYGQDWFLNFNLLEVPLRELFQVQPYSLSVAVWVGFLALFGIASDDGVIMATYLDQSFEQHEPDTVRGIRLTVIKAGKRRIRPCLMTLSTTVLALLPIITSTGRGAGVMIPMAIPTIGGMTVTLVGMFVVPVLYASVKEFQLRHKLAPGAAEWISALSLFALPVLSGTLSSQKKDIVPGSDA